MCECVSSGADGVVDAMASLEHAFEVGVVVMGDGSVKVCVCVCVCVCDGVEVFGAPDLVPCNSKQRRPTISPRIMPPQNTCTVNDGMAN